MHRQNFHYNTGQPSNEQVMAAMMENDAAALAAEMFDHFCSAVTMRQIFGLFRNMCDTVGIRPGPINEFYPKLKAKIKNWKAQALWKKFDTRLLHRVYNKGTACTGTRVLVIGAGPCGLRTAIEAQLLGAKVVVVEKRDRISRNNVLHLWPFLIHDLRALGAKKFYGKFCAGSIDHISIRQLQCILLKVALLLGIEIHEGVSFESIVEPSSEGLGWRCTTSPNDHAVSHFEFDVLIGADGKRNTLSGFGRKEFRGKLAIAITANFINRRTEEEARVEEISGVAFIFNQSFFKELYHQTGIDLENIVYYKDETHYFVMTAKKHSLLDKGVILQDFSDPAELLHPNNVNTTKLQDYAREAADFSTKYQMPTLEFAVNHYGKPDVAMFDFTSMFAAENSSRVVVRKNYRLLMCIVGDSLLEPFWPSGSGCARGFLSAMDAAYAIKLYSNPNNSLLSILAQRESIYRLLAQTTPENLHRDHGSYTLDPMTRYPNLNRQFVLAHQVKHLLDTDDPTLLEQTFMDTNVMQSLPEPPLKTRKRRTADTTPMANILLSWIKNNLKDQEFIADIVEPSQIFTNGKVLCALIHRYRPELCDWNAIQELSAEESNEIAFQTLEKDFKIPRVMSADESLTLQDVDIKTWLHYLEQICEVFRGEIPHVKHPKLDYAEFKQKNQNNNKMSDFAKLHRIAAAKREAANDENGARKSRDKLPVSPPPANVEHRRGRKRRSYEKYGGNIEERMARLAEIDANRIDRQNRRREHRKNQTENFLKSLQMLQVANYLRESGVEADSEAFEDYSIYMYRQTAPEFTDRVKELEKKLLYPDRERGIPSALPKSGNVLDDPFSNRIRNIEEKFTTKNAAATNKKPKDLLRAIGKIESNDWNVKEIEKKIQMSKKITDIGKSREKVPKWSREQFEARQNKMQKPDRQDSTEVKYKEIDDTIKALDKQLKEGSALDRGERGRNKVAAIAAATFGKKKGEENQQPSQKSGLILSSQGISESCHFCKQRVYLMEKINAEGLILHRSCLKCHHCHTNLRLGGYAFDRENPDGKFYCTQHFKLPPKDSKFVPKRLQHKQRQAEYAAFKAQQHKHRNTGDDKTTGDDLDNRGKTPERIEFENADGGSEGEQPFDQIMDENEWTDLNFGTGDEDSVDDESSDDETDSDTDSEIFEDPVGVDAQTLQLASEWIDKRSTMQDSEDEFYGYSSEDDDADSQTEGEELAKAREMRMNEVKLQPPPTYILTDTETEGVKNSMTQNNENINNQNPDLVSNNPQSNNPSITSNSFIPSSLNNPKDELLKNDMMKKLSLKEKWLNESQQQNIQQPSSITNEPKPVHMEVDEHINDSKKKEEKKSFLNGIFSSVKQFIKHEKPQEKRKSPSPPPAQIDAFEEILKEAENESLVGNVERKVQKFLQKQKSEEVREEADDILNEIKEEKDRLEKHMRDMEQKRFSDNMQAIKSSVAESKVASMKEVNLAKYFPKQQDKKPPAIAKNRDVKALKDVNLSKYFPSSPPAGKKISSSPAEQSATSSAAQSPLTPRKNINEIDLANYFPSTPTTSRKTSTCTPPSSPLSENPPSLSRKNSITRFNVANTIPANPPPPAPKKNILSLQSVKKQTPKIDSKNDKKENIQKPDKIKLDMPKDKKKKNDFNMFDQLLDGVVDLDHAKDIDIESFDTLIEEQKLESSPSKEYEKIFDAKLLNGSSSESKEVSQVDVKKIKKKSEKATKKSNETEKDASENNKSKRKSPTKKNEEVNGLNLDPKIIQLLNKEYQRLLVEYERFSKSPENEDLQNYEINNETVENESIQNSEAINKDLLPEQSSRKSEHKRKSPQRNEDCKKFKENVIESEIMLIEDKQASSNDTKVADKNEKTSPRKMSIDVVDMLPVIEEEESIISRLERKYRRSSIKSAENVEHAEQIISNDSKEQVVNNEMSIKPVQQVENLDDKKTDEEKPYSIIERLEQKLRQKKVLAENFSSYRPVDDYPSLESVSIVKKQDQEILTIKNQSENHVDSLAGPLVQAKVYDQNIEDNSLVIRTDFGIEDKKNESTSEKRRPSRQDEDLEYSKMARKYSIENNTENHQASQNSPQHAKKNEHETYKLHDEDFGVVEQPITNKKFSIEKTDEFDKIFQDSPKLSRKGSLKNKNLNNDGFNMTEPPKSSRKCSIEDTEDFDNMFQDSPRNSRKGSLKYQNLKDDDFGIMEQPKKFSVEYDKLFQEALKFPNRKAPQNSQNINDNFNIIGNPKDSRKCNIEDVEEFDKILQNSPKLSRKGSLKYQNLNDDDFNMIEHLRNSRKCSLEDSADFDKIFQDSPRNSRKSSLKTQNLKDDDFGIVEQPRKFSAEYEQLFQKTSSSTKPPMKAVQNINGDNFASEKPKGSRKCSIENISEFDKIVQDSPKLSRKGSLKHQNLNNEDFNMNEQLNSSRKCSIDHTADFDKVIQESPRLSRKGSQKYKKSKEHEEDLQRKQNKHDENSLKSQRLLKDETSESSHNSQEKLPKKHKNPTKSEVECYESLFSLPKENINDIFSEFQMTEMETEKALKEFQDNFETLNGNDEPLKSNKNNKKKNPKNADIHKHEKYIDNDRHDIKIEKNLKNDEIEIENLDIKDKCSDANRNIMRLESEPSYMRNSELKSVTSTKIDEPVQDEIYVERRKSIQDDLIEIESGISERPININDLFGRRNSGEHNNKNGSSIVEKNNIEINEGSKSNKKHEIEDYGEPSDVNYGRRSSKDKVKYDEITQASKNFADVTDAPVKNEMSTQESLGRQNQSQNYFNVLKEISNEIIGFDDEPVLITATDWKPEIAQVNINKEPSLPKDKINQNYTNVLQDISNSLVGSDFYNIDVAEKNYSQIIPPNVQDLKSMVDSSDYFEAPNARLRGFRDDNSTDTEILTPVPPPRRHKLAEKTSPDNAYNPRRKVLSPTKSFDDTISGISSTEYFDHYYSVNNNNFNQLDKYDLTAPTISKEPVVLKAKPLVADDTEEKYSGYRRHLSESPVRKISTSLKIYDDDNYDSKILSERSKLLHQRKESFMRGQASDSSNPYIREMMRQDVDNPLNIRDIKFIRKHPSVPLPTSSHKITSEKYQPRTLSSPSSRVQLSYGRSQIAPTSSYSRTPLSSTNYKSSISSYNPSSTTSHIHTKSHTLTPPSNYGSSSYTSRNRAITSLSDPITTSHSRSRPLSYSTTTNNNNKSSRLSSRDAQSDTESDEVLNSATEISTDSEFDQDPINHDPPKIYIDDSHLRKHPGRVHMRHTRTEAMKNAENSRTHNKHDQNVHLKFKPLVEVDPSIVRREPLKNPLPGNYLLSKTASTEGIASKKSLELKKRYLLGGDTGTNAVLKSDSASALDIKLKSFASNISECQKLLNPANEISPSMQTFLQRIDRNNELNKSQHSFGISKELKDKYNNNNNSNDQEEKENCSLDSNKKKQEVTIETVNTTLIENKIREMSPEVPKLPDIEIIETIDLTTPEKKQPIIDLDNVEIPQNTIDDNKQFIENMEKSTSIQETNMKIKNKLDSMFIDLTADSPPKENHLNGTANNEPNNNNKHIAFTNNSVPDIISNISTKLNGSSKDEESIERPRSPAHETTIEVPQMWTKAVTEKDIDTDSLSNESSTSSLQDIPHFILDSATSPETQNENSNLPTQPPRLEVRDTSGELMQIDSLMIIDGLYVGDPEDLPLFEDQSKSQTSTEKNENSSMEPSLTHTKPLKFDTKNENKLESLKNLPLIVAHEDIPKESHVHLRFSDQLSPLQTPEDGDKTPLAGAPLHISDSENEITGQGLTETELSDWAADDAVSENFMDIEFALNSGKGTMKRNKKVKSHRSESEKLHLKSLKNNNKNESECGILRNLAIEEIDFMDTGSEAESIETHSASNRVVLKNHGYVKFVDHQHNNNSTSRNAYNAYDIDKNKSKEKSPPPVVEAINMEIVNVDFIEQGAYILNNNNDNDSNISEQKTPINEDDGGQLLDSLNASCEEIDDDSLIVAEEKNLESLPTTTTTTFTTTETEDLTIVTSPLESLPRNIVEPSTPTNNTTLSSTVITSTSTSTDKDLERARFERNSAERASNASRMSREHIEEMGGYEEYVKSLQMKIAQISNGRESLEKKTRRKLSKSDLLGSSETPDDFINQHENKSIFGTLIQVEAPQTLSKKLEELTKERTKQKDIIHDLVMNKLQAKKQLNAEKRLNRSKNRSNYMSSIQQPNSDQQVSNVLTEISPNKEQMNSNSNVINYKEKMYHNNDYSTIDSFKSQSAHSSPTKVTKTQSFSYFRHKSHERNGDDSENFKTPAPPPRNRLYSDLLNTAEKMREDARARAKLMSNEDLGLSPEEKILLLRKRYNLVHAENGQNTSSSSLFANGRNQSDDMKYREKKLSTSKSFNDISRMNRFSKEFPTTNFQKPMIDCMSDPNLADVSTKNSTKDVTPSTKTTKSHRRDSDRRRSLIQTVSDFFHKKRDQSASNKDLTSAPSTASKDKLSENSSSSLSVFSRFKISPKSKESSKDKAKDKEATPPYTNERSRSVASLKQPVMTAVEIDDQAPPIPPLPKNYQRSDDEDCLDTNETKNELKKLRAMSKASKQAELKRLRIAQEIKREQDEIDMKIKDLETRGVEIEKYLRGEGQNTEQQNESSLSQIGATDEELLKELLDIWRNITQLKKRDEELIIRQQELQLEHRHAQLKEELSIRLSCSKLDKSAQDVAAEGAILSEMLEIVSKRAALRPADYPSSSPRSENVSLPVLPPQTTINPLLQHQYNHQASANASPRYQPQFASNRSNVTHQSFSSQSHNQEHDI